MKHKLILCLLAALLALGLTPARAASPVAVQVDGHRLPGTAYLEAGVTYVALRELLDAFGGWETAWDGARRAAVARSGESRLVAAIGDAHVTLDGARHEAGGAAFLREGRTYVPLRAVAEALDAQVAWDPYLHGAAVTSPHFDQPCSAADFYWLARIISAESQGEPLEGQVAVGNVVLNRVASPDFPDTIPGVIFDRVDAIQFEPVGNGTVYLDPTEQSVAAARLVLAGEDAVGDAMFFYAPALSPGTWINANRTYSQTIGGHRFYL